MGVMTLAWILLAPVIGFSVPRALDWQKRLIMLEAHDVSTTDIRLRALNQIERMAEVLATHLQDTNIHAVALGKIDTRLNGIDKQLDRIESNIAK